MTETETYTEWEITFRTDGAWGLGKGSNLTPAEVDNNFYSLHWSIEQLEAAGDGGGITAINVTGAEISVTVDDGDTSRIFGPFSLPSATVRWREEYVPVFPYLATDLLVEDNTLYIVTQDHTSATDMDPTEEGSEGPLYHRVRGGAEFYDIAGYVPGSAWAFIYTPTVLLRLVATRSYTIPAGDTDDPAGHAFMRVAPLLDTVCPLARNGVIFGYIEVLAGQTVGSVTIDTPPVFVAGDRFEVLAPLGHAVTETETGTEGHGRDLSFTITAFYTSQTGEPPTEETETPLDGLTEVTETFTPKPISIMITG